MIDRLEYNKVKNMPPVDFNKISLGAKKLEDAILKLGTYQKVNSQFANKVEVLRAIDSYDLPTMRKISDFFYKTSGIYARILRYMAFMYRYDFLLTPQLKEPTSVNQKKLMVNFYKGLNILDEFKVKKNLGNIALEVVKYGVYYGYKIPVDDTITLQQLPADYCRSRFNKGDKPVVEFNMRYFDAAYLSQEQREKVLNLFPQEFRKGYALFKANKLPPQFLGDTPGWFLLEPDATVRFTVNGEEYPPFISVIPLILDLDTAQELDRKKTLQRLLKIVVQKLPLDKNGEMLFDTDEAQLIHDNAVAMLARTIGVQVLTTFADVEVEDMAEASATASSNDDLAKIERQLFNEAGISQMQFNTDGNLALEKSILNDEATMFNLILQFEDFLNELIQPLNTNKNIKFHVQLLPTTIYNFKEMAKLYKEQMQLGFSKMLPQIALGQSQSNILATAYFENEVLDLVNVFVPPLMSSTMNAEVLSAEKNKDAGRNELPDDQKSTKTIQNIESTGGKG